MKPSKSKRTTKRPPPPCPSPTPLDPNELAYEIGKAIAVPLARILAAITVAAQRPETDDWISQRDSHALPARIRCRLCRDLAARGDPRAAIRGREHLLRRSAIDEYLKGMPRPAAPAAPDAKSASVLTAGERVELELRELGLWQ